MMFLCAFSVAGVSCSVVKYILKALGWGFAACSLELINHIVLAK
jgi:hypothetical protein